MNRILSEEEVAELEAVKGERLEAENWKAINPLWRLADPLTVHQAAALIAGHDPNCVRFNLDQEPWFESDSGWRDSDGISSVKAALAGLMNAINAGLLKATIRRDARIQGWDEWPNHGESLRSLYDDDGDIRNGFEPAVIYRESPDWGKTTVAVSDLVAWLRASNLRPNFFFNSAADTNVDSAFAAELNRARARIAELEHERGALLKKIEATTEASEATTINSPTLHRILGAVADYPAWRAVQNQEPNLKTVLDWQEKQQDGKGNASRVAHVAHHVVAEHFGLKS